MTAEENQREAPGTDSPGENESPPAGAAAEVAGETAAEPPEAAPAAEAVRAASAPGAAAPPAPEDGEVEVTATRAELKPVIETLLFVADEPLPFNQLCKILGEVEAADVRAALDELAGEYEARAGGLEIREIAGGWRISTRPEFHEFVRKYLKSKPTARLSLPALETLAVIAYKQPITIPEILEIRGVSSTSAIKTLLEKRLIITKGRKETVGRPMMYGTSKDFLLHFGLRDLSELPSIEDFEDLAG
jgi:segregation and condensation protein B